MRLTAKEIAAYRWPDRADTIAFDDDIAGFGLRSREGRMSWVFQYAIGAHGGRVTRRIKIGDYPALSPTTARKEAETLHAKVHLHGDPALERRKNRLEAGKTFGRLVAQYLEYQRDQLRPRSYNEVERHLDSHARPLHDLPLAAVDRETIARLLSQLGQRGKVVPNRTRASLSALFTWAMGEGLALTNPVTGTNRRAEKSRDRVLTAPELSMIWHALQGDDYGVIVKLLVLTGQRAGEIGGLCWSEIDFEREVISLPGERTKNGRPHEIPMARTVLELLRARTRHGDRELVFGKRGGPYSRWTEAKALLDARIGVSSPWVVHDLRRTVATGMADIGMQPHIIEAVLNHVSGHKGGVAGIYNRASSYAAEKAAALARWDEHVTSIVGGE